MGLKTNKYLMGIYEPRYINEAMRDFLKIHRGNTIKVDRRKFCITIDGKEYYFLTPGVYDAWCIGRTYYYGDKLYRSGKVVNHEYYPNYEVDMRSDKE